MKAKLLTLALACLFLTSCLNEKAVFQKLIPKDDDALARHFIELIRTGEYVVAQQMLAPSLRDDQAIRTLSLIHDKFLHGEPLEIETINYNISTNITASGETRRTILFYQLHFRGAWVVGNIVLDRVSEGSAIVGFHFYPTKDSLEVINRFTLSGKSPAHYAVLFLCVLIPIFILYSLTVCVLTRVRRKWLWIIFILFGLVQFRFNWTTGASDIQPISIVLLGSGYHAASFCAPWILNWALPVGAFVFLLRRHKLTTPPVIGTSNFPQL